MSPGLTTRRALLAGLGGLAGVAAAGAVGLELVDRGVLPGKQTLMELDGACQVPAPRLSFARRGPSFSGTFYSRARRREVGYTIAYPPGHARGDELPLVVALHAYGSDHSDVLRGLTPATALAIRQGDVPLPPMALAAADGGGGYWNPHPGDNPLAMVTDELIPRCQRLGLGTRAGGIGSLGISMGGYGAILLAEKFPELISAVAAISPAIWTSFAQARSVNRGAYASAAAFAWADAITHASALAGVAVRIAAGLDDPFRPGVEELARRLPVGSVVKFPPGCHSSPFFYAQEPPSLAFLGRHLGAREQ